MYQISKEASPNYLAKVVEITNLRPIEGADRIQIAVIDFQDVVVSKDVQLGDIMVYFPVECAINTEFLSYMNVFRNPSLNKDKESKGFFEEKGRVKAIKLMKGTVKSMGYVVPSYLVSAWAGCDIFAHDAGIEFDTIGGKLLVKKYKVEVKEPRTQQGKAPKVSRLVEGQVHLHIDTANLRRNADKIKPYDDISISYKTHGTSWWVSNVLVKKNLNWFEKLLKRIGVNIIDTEYDLVYGSRRVVKNKSFDDPKQGDHFYGYDLWEDIKNEVGENLPKGYTLYGEMLGFDKNGKAIQKGYDYGCKVNGPETHKIQVYRITHTNPDGLVTELNWSQIETFCAQLGLKTPMLFFRGTAAEWLETWCGMDENDVMIMPDRDFQETFVTKLEEYFNEKDCFMCENKVPEEGIVIRKENLFNCESYKLKSFRFLEHESKELDKGESDVESEN